MPQETVKLHRVQFHKAPVNIHWSVGTTDTFADVRDLPGNVPADARAEPGQGREVPAANESGQSAAPIPDSSSTLAPPLEPSLLDLQQSILDRLEELEQRRQQSMTEMRRLAVEIATAVAGRILQRTMDAGEAGIPELVAAAAERFDATGPLKVYLHPLDVERWKGPLLSEPPALLESEHLTILPDRQLHRGDCRIDNGSFSLVFQWESQLTEIREHLLRTVHDAATERRIDSSVDRKLGRFPDRREIA